MSAKKTQVPASRPGSISRRTFLGAVGALVGGLAAASRASSNPAPARYALVEYPRSQLYPLRAGINRIGRATENDIIFRENCISRRHCVLCVFDDGEFELRDTGSRNGTFVNGERVTQSVRPSVGDFIRICDHGLVLVDLTAMPPLLEQESPVPGSLEWAEANGYLDTAYVPGYVAGWL